MPPVTPSKLAKTGLHFMAQATPFLRKHLSASSQFSYPSTHEIFVSKQRDRAGLVRSGG